MALFDKFQQIAEARRAIAESGMSSINVVMEQVISPTEAIINGRRTILAGTNNYLGLTFHPECVEAACQALPAFRAAHPDRQPDAPPPERRGP
jgi:8-amino-7-oxononanoate synthase